MSAVVLMSVVCFTADTSTEVAPAYTPTADYAERELQGFRVRLHPRAQAEPDDLTRGMDELEAQLIQIRRVVPDGPLAELVRTPIWVEWAVRPRGACEVHVSAGWLRENGYNPEKLHAVEICNLVNFVDWSRRAQPWMILHELAHAYHHRVLGDHPEALALPYRLARDQGLYEQIRYVQGTTQRAYALTNMAEYFAEASEAYFGKNDFYPFTATELSTYDPAGYEMCRSIWGLPVDRSLPAAAP
jgi:hypothetical protein